MSSGPSLLIRFYANGGTGLGYKAFYSFVIGHPLDKSVQPITDCGGYVENLGGTITMLDMVGEGVKTYDCVWLIRPPKNFLHMKTHMYLKVITFADMGECRRVIPAFLPSSIGRRQSVYVVEDKIQAREADKRVLVCTLFSIIVENRKQCLRTNVGRNARLGLIILLVFAFVSAGNTELVVKQGPTSALLPLEILRHPASQVQPPRHREHVAPVTSGFHVSLRGTFGSSSHLAIAYAAFSYMGERNLRESSSRSIRHCLSSDHSQTVSRDRTFFAAITDA